MNNIINWIVSILGLAAFFVLVIFGSKNSKPDPFFKEDPTKKESSTYQPQFHFGLGSDGVTPFF